MKTPEQQLEHYKRETDNQIASLKRAIQLLNNQLARTVNQNTQLKASCERLRGNVERLERKLNSVVSGFKAERDY